MEWGEGRGPSAAGVPPGSSGEVAPPGAAQGEREGGRAGRGRWQGGGRGGAVRGREGRWPASPGFVPWGGQEGRAGPLGVRSSAEVSAGLPAGVSQVRGASGVSRYPWGLSARPSFWDGFGTRSLVSCMAFWNRLDRTHSFWFLQARLASP